MTLRDKLRHILHPGSKKHSATSPTSPSAPSKTSASSAKSDPNKPPNARDPGFRKSFDMGDAAGDDSVTSPRDIGFNRPENQNITGNGDEKLYGDDYLAVSPRTNTKTPDSAGANGSISTVTPLEEAKVVSSQTARPNETVSGGASPTQDKGQFANGERKADSGYVEPSPTREAATVKNSPTSEHTAVFDPPATTQGTTVSPPPTEERPDTKRASSLLAIPGNATEDGASSIYSDDSSRPQLQQVDSHAYSQFSDSPVLSPSAPPTAVAHQQRYTILVSDVLPINTETPLFPDTQTTNGENSDFLAAVRASFSHGSKMSPPEVTPDESDSWSQGLIADIGKIEGTASAPIPSNPNTQKGAFAPMATIPDTNLSVEQQAEAFADIIAANVARLKLENTGQESHGIPDAASGSVGPKDEAAAPIQRPPLVHDDSVYAVTKDIPGAF
ncbi:hypothetical protein Dda_2292 [Drechslerella dactyloides]|uniref:Uncharacterized protein n=1 Tax=Drechslerella dactyloides TaxID=74499 RepID=A0AAD6NMI2_DREDA|nr:hypothetical protein Dda_2292 [Drechslerella dactyloides]